MIGIVTALVLLVSAVSLTTGAIIHNQIEPSYATALTIPFANMASLIVAFAGMVIAIVARRENRETNLAKGTMVFGIVCFVVLLALFPLADLGMLSKVR